VTEGRHVAACHKPPRQRRRRPLMYACPSDFTMCVRNQHARKLAEAMRKQMRKHAKSHVREKRRLHAFPRCESSCLVQKHDIRGSSRKRCGSIVRKQTFIHTQAQEFRHTPTCQSSECATMLSVFRAHRQCACRLPGCALRTRTPALEVVHFVHP
jgi:hypothetical protein